MQLNKPDLKHFFFIYIANVDMSVSLRDVLLNIEDTTFATLAALSSTIRIEDETSPDDECLSPTESESAEFPQSKTGELKFLATIINILPIPKKIRKI